MTSESVNPVRRSQRIKEIVSSQPVIDDETIEGAAYDDEEEEEEEEEEDFEERPRKKRKTGKSTKISTGAKRSAGSKKKAVDAFNEMRDNFEENYIFQALNDAEASTSELANDWLEQYKSNKDLAKKDLINLVLNSVGCFTTIEEHDVSNNESASETVSEIQTFFKRQQNHEFYLTSKKPAHKHLKKNYISFINEIISTSDENGLLYENIVISEGDEEVEEPEDSNLMEDLLIWLSSFSVSYIRSLRYVSTLSLLTIETTLCRIIVKVNSSLEKFKHQLDVEQSKAKSTSKALKKRVKQIESNVNQFTNQSLILENFIQDILNTTFIHRFKDIDHHIRVEAMNSLGEWMDIYPELFFKVTYLKYLGWVLSDENSSVRLQVIRTLIRLLKKNFIVSGLRQFFERFKTRIIEIAFHDVDHHVRTNAINLLTEINKVGFLEDEEIGKVSSLIFSSKDSKIIQIVSKFIQNVESENSKAAIEALSVNIKSSEKLFPISLKDLIKTHNLIEILSIANEVHSETRQKAGSVKSSDLERSIFAQAGEELFDLPAYSEYWEFLIKYYLLDISSIEVADDELVKAIQLTGEQETILFGLIHGSLIHLKKVEDEAKEKKGEVDESSSQRLISYLPLLLKKAENNDVNLSSYIQILCVYPLEFFENLNQANIYKSIFQQLIKHLKQNSIESLKNEYISLFKTLSNSSDSSTAAEINILFKDTITELTIEFENFLKDSEFELSSSTLKIIHTDYSFKLLILGLRYDITEIFKTFDLVKEKVLTVLPDFEIGKDEVTSLSLLLKTYLSSTSWKLNFLLHTKESLNIETELSQIPTFVEELQYLLSQNNDIKFQTEIASVLIDLLTLLKNFFMNPNTSLSNLNRFYDIDLSSLSLSQETINVLLGLFLHKEAIFANLNEVQLDREDDEDVNLNSVKLDVDDLDTDELAVAKWDAEKDLVIYSVKLLGLAKIEILSSKDVERVELNKEVLGDLFHSVFEELEANQREEEKNVSDVVHQRQQKGEEEDEDNIPEIAMDD